MSLYFIRRAVAIILLLGVAMWVSGLWVILT